MPRKGLQKGLVFRVMSSGIIMLALLLGICSCTADGKTEGNGLPLLEYSYYRVTDEPQDRVFDPNDVISPIVEKKFNIRVGKVVYNQGLSFKDRLNQMIAANELPDVVSAVSQVPVLLASSGFFAETGDLIKQNMPNLLKYCPETEWKDALYKGKMYSIPSPWIDVTEPAYQDDLYSVPQPNWTWIARESVLQELGYEFKPLKEIEKEINSSKGKPRLEDYRIQPEIKTPDDFYTFLKSIKERNMEVNGRPVIPFSIPNVLQMHLGYMFGCTGSWNYDAGTGEVDGYLGSKNAREYYLFLNKLYREGLIDRDFMVQKPEQLQEKITSGQVAACMWIPDPSRARAGIRSVNSDDEFRPMFMPLEPDVRPAGIDHVSKVTFQYFIRKDFEDIPRLLRYFDWFLSDEALDLNSWGPDSTGVWEEKNGKKLFKDHQLYEQLVKGVSGKGELAYENYWKYGMGYNSKAFRAAPSLNGYNPKDWRRSYPFQVVDIFSYSWSMVSNRYIDTEGFLLQGVDEVSDAAGAWFLNEFIPQKSATLILARDQEEFDQNWNQVFREFQEEGRYEEGKSVMTALFQKRMATK